MSPSNHSIFAVSLTIFCSSFQNHIEWTALSKPQFPPQGRGSRSAAPGKIVGIFYSWLQDPQFKLVPCPRTFGPVTSATNNPEVFDKIGALPRKWLHVVNLGFNERASAKGTLGSSPRLAATTSSQNLAPVCVAYHVLHYECRSIYCPALFVLALIIPCAPHGVH